MADLSYRLATIKTDVDLDITPKQLTLGASNNDKLTEYSAVMNLNVGSMK